MAAPARPPVADRSKDFPLTITGSMFVSSVLESTGLKKPTTGNTFLALKVKAENRMDKDISVKASEFGVVYAYQRYEYDYLVDLKTDPRFDSKEFRLGIITAKSSVEGWMIFEVPQSMQTAVKAELRFTDVALFGGGQYSYTRFDPSQITKYDTNSQRLIVEAKTVTITYKFTDEDGEVKVFSQNELFAVCDLLITNNARTKTYLSVNDIELTTAKDNGYSQEYMYNPKNKLESKNIDPMAIIRGSVVMAVLSDDIEVKSVLIKYSDDEIIHI